MVILKMLGKNDFHKAFRFKSIKMKPLCIESGGEMKFESDNTLSQTFNILSAKGHAFSHCASIINNIKTGVWYLHLANTISNQHEIRLRWCISVLCSRPAGSFNKEFKNYCTNDQLNTCYEKERQRQKGKEGKRVKWRGRKKKEVMKSNIYDVNETDNNCKRYISLWAHGFLEC